MKNRKGIRAGFSVVELIIIIAVLGILAAVLIPTFASVIRKANEKSALSDARNAATQFQMARGRSADDNPLKVRNMVAFVFKAGKFYVYSYGLDSTGGRMLASSGNPFVGYEEDELGVLIEDYSCSVEDYMAGDYGEAYFCVVPVAAGTVIAPTDKGVYVPGYNFLNPDLRDIAEDVSVYEGYLVPTLTEEVDSTSAVGSDSDGSERLARVTVTYLSGSDFVFNAPAQASIVANREYTIASPNVTRDGYEFAGWLADDTVRLYQPGQVVGFGSNQVLTAQWNRLSTLTFIISGEGGPKPIPVGALFTDNGFIDEYTQLARGALISDKFTPNIPTSATYHIAAWATADGVDSYATNGSDDPVMMPTTDLTLYAVWEGIPFSVTYSSGTLDTVTNMPNEEVIGPAFFNSSADRPFVLPTAIPSRIGYAFVGWRHNGVTYAAGATCDNLPAAAITFTAIWGHSISFDDLESGSVYLRTELVECGATFTIPVDARSLTKPGGFICNSWSYAGNVYGASTTWEITLPATGGSNVVFTAIWQLTAFDVTVTFFDTWNEQSPVASCTVQVNGLGAQTVSYTAVAENAPSYFIPATQSVTVTTVAGGGPYTVTFNGERIKSGYKLITTQIGLKKIGSSTTAVAGKYELFNNIALSNANFAPIGWTGSSHTSTGAFTGRSFSGEFKGEGKTISGFYANFGTTNGNSTYVGLFASTTNTAVITNFNLVCTSSVFGYMRVGSVVGDNSGTISLVHVVNTDYSVGAQNTTSSGGAAGGIAGYNSGGTITGCTTSICQVFAYNFAGGITGYNSGGTVSNCTAYGGVNEAYSDRAPYADMSLFTAGGIVGHNTGTITGCNVALEDVVICGTAYVGGIVGRSYGGSVSDCLVTLKGGMSITAYVMTGGVAGLMRSGATVTNCHVWLSSTNEEIGAGGWNSYSFTCVSSTKTASYVGGVAGCNDGGLISRSSCTGPSGAFIASFNTGGTGYYCWAVGGIAGASCAASSSTLAISECWTYKALLNRHMTSGNSGNIGCLMAVGGIVGYNLGGKVANCWSRGATLTAWQYGGGIAGANIGTLECCWSYFGGATGSSSYIGDTISSNCNSGSCTNLAIEDKYYSASMGTNYGSLANTMPSGFSTTYWQTSANGPMLRNNPFVATRNID